MPYLQKACRLNLHSRFLDAQAEKPDSEFERRSCLFGVEHKDGAPPVSPFIFPIHALETDQVCNSDVFFDSGIICLNYVPEGKCERHHEQAALLAA